MKRTTSAPGLLLHLERKAGLPLRMQLQQELRTAIRSGRLRAGAHLPSSRALAVDLGISRGLVVEAYEQLRAERYVVARQGSATTVTARPPAARGGKPPKVAPAAARPRYDFRPMGRAMALQSVVAPPLVYVKYTTVVAPSSGTP